MEIIILKNIPTGSARLVIRALSISYDKFDITPFRQGWVSRLPLC